MLVLMLMRHGQAVSPFDAEHDHSRDLSEFGKIQTTHQGRLFLSEKTDTLLVSDANRTRQTAQVLLSTWSDMDALHLPSAHITETAYLADASTLMELVRMTPSHVKRLWLIAHNPGVSEFAAMLTKSYISMGTANIAEVHLSIDQWLDIAPDTGHLAGHHLSPRP